MKFFDNKLRSIYKIFNSFVDFLKKITRIEMIKKFERFTEKINSSALIISSIMIMVIGLVAYARMQYFGWILPFAIFGPIVFLFIAYLANDFHNACSDLIDSNKTSLSNNAVLKFGAIISLFLSALLFVVGVVAIFNGSLSGTIYSLLASLFLFISAGTQFNPSLLNIEITKQSTSGEDFISIFSLNLKSMVFFEKIISTILIVLGNIYLLANLFTHEMEFFMYGVGFLSAGIAYPIIIYILFTVLWFFNSLFLGILSLGRKKIK
jgi:hypothetical protein